MKSVFFSFSKPYIALFDSGSFFKKPIVIIYFSLAILNLLVPLFILYKGLDSKLLEADLKIIIAFFLSWVIILFSFWIGFQIFWDRKNNISNRLENDEFVVTPIISHFFQTVGEWFGTVIGIIGFLTPILGFVILQEDSKQISRFLQIPFLNANLYFAFLAPIIGFSVIYFSRFIAEQFKIFSAIANNTKK